MKVIAKKTLVLALAAVIGLSVATPARADWYDGHRYHHGHVPHGWVWDAYHGYYVYQPAYVVAPPPVVVAQPAPPPVIVAAPPPQVVYAAPQPVYVAPAPPPPVGLSLGVHIH